MNFKNVFPPLAVGFVLATMISGCNGGASDRGTSNTVYGQYVSSASAGSNLEKDALQDFLTNAVVCSGIKGDDITSKQICAANQAYISNDVSFGVAQTGSNVRNFVTNTNPDITSIERDQLIYTTPGAPMKFANGATSLETVSGLVLLPLDSAGKAIPTKDIKGVVIYYHPTILSKYGVPSGYGSTETTDPSNARMGYSNAEYFQNELAAIYANSGYIVVAPDYVGQGIDAATVHPYVMFPTPNALSGIYMLTALKTFLAKKGVDLTQINNGQPDLFISSYSEGGAYAVKAANLVQNGYGNIVTNAGLTLKRTVGVSGAYDLTGSMLPFAFDDASNSLDPKENIYNTSPGCDPRIISPIAGQICTESSYPIFRATSQPLIASGKPPLGSYMVNAMVVYDYTPAAYDMVMVPAYAKQETCLNAASLAESTFSYQSCASLSPADGGLGGAYTVQDLFNPNGLTNAQIATQLIVAASGSSLDQSNKYSVGPNTNTAELSQALATGQAYNSVSNFIYSNLLDDANVMTNVAEANTYNLSTSTPISLVFMKYDSTVTNLDSFAACSTTSSSLLTNSAPGLVKCVADAGIPSIGIAPTMAGINNTNFWIVMAEAVGPLTLALPLYMDHNDAEGNLQLVALAQMQGVE